ncbi:MAG: hypothetical protein HXL36_09750 [Prevotellaceae bacterium]|nr:hypothetical protein [Prevotellaceae bacterium]
MKKTIAILAALATTVAQAEFTGYKPEELKTMQVEDIQSKFDLTPEESKVTYDTWQKLPMRIPFNKEFTTEDIGYGVYIGDISDNKLVYSIRYRKDSIEIESEQAGIYGVNNKYALFKTNVVCEGPYGTYLTDTTDQKGYQQPIAFDPICMFYNPDYYLSSYNEGDIEKKEQKANELRNMSELDYTALLNENGIFVNDKIIFNALANFPNLPTSLKEGEHVDMVELVGKDYNGDIITNQVRYTLLDANTRKWGITGRNMQGEFQCVSHYAKVQMAGNYNPICMFYNEIQKASL